MLLLLLSRKSALLKPPFVRVSVDSDDRRCAGWPAGRLDGGEDWQEAQPDVLLAALRLRFYPHHRGAERVDALRWPHADGPRQRCHVAGRPGNRNSYLFLILRNVGS